jgi:hypothetical protein
MVFASGIHLNTIMFENDVKYGEFVFLAKKILFENYKKHRISIQILTKMHFRLFFFKASN